MVIIGLGNPGEKFKDTRHNAGFMAVDFFAKENQFPEFKLAKKYGSLISENGGIMLAKPQTFMNESGGAVKKLIANFKFQNSNLVVVHDDIDLPLGKFKIVKNSGAGGHKGVASIIENLRTKDFLRIKIGICPTKGKPALVEKFVIKKFSEEEKETVIAAVAKTAKTLAYFIENGPEKTMNEFN